MKKVAVIGELLNPILHGDINELLRHKVEENKNVLYKIKTEYTPIKHLTGQEKRRLRREKKNKL